MELSSLNQILEGSPNVTGQSSLRTQALFWELSDSPQFLHCALLSPSKSEKLSAKYLFTFRILNGGDMKILRLFPNLMVYVLTKIIRDEQTGEQQRILTAFKELNIQHPSWKGWDSSDFSFSFHKQNPCHNIFQRSLP